MAFKYTIGDRVRIKSIDWYYKTKNEYDNVDCGSTIFIPDMVKYCEKIVTISSVLPILEVYHIKEDGGMFNWTDEMIEELVEEEAKPELKFKVGNRVRIKSLDWYNKNKTSFKGTNFVDCDCGRGSFTDEMVKYCGEVVTIESIDPYYGCYFIKEDKGNDLWTDEMIEGLVEEETKPKFKVGDRVIVRDASGIWEITNVEDNILYTIKRENHTFTLTTYGGFLTLYEGISDKMIESKVEEGVKNWADVSIPDGPYTVTYDSPSMNDSMSKNNIHNEIVLPEGYIFKDENGNEILTSKIILEKVNTLKTQSDNMETETHKGYCTTEPETTNKSKKVAWFTFWDNDFADKVELDLSNRELIQEDGKWFVVKKKKEYPKTYEECREIVKVGKEHTLEGEIIRINNYKIALLETFQKLLICRDAYWTLYGEEKGLGKPWEPDYDSGVNKYGIICMNGVVQESNPTTNWERHLNKVLDFPTAEMRDTFKKNFDPDIEFCKEFL